MSMRICPNNDHVTWSVKPNPLPNCNRLRLYSSSPSMASEKSSGNCSFWMIQHIWPVLQNAHIEELTEYMWPYQWQEFDVEHVFQFRDISVQKQITYPGQKGTVNLLFN